MIKGGGAAGATLKAGGLKICTKIYVWRGTTPMFKLYARVPTPTDIPRFGKRHKGGTIIYYMCKYPIFSL